MTGAPTLELRSMTAADLDAVHRLEVEASPDPWSRELLAGELDGDRADRLWLVALAPTADGSGSPAGTSAIVGFGGALQVVDEAHIMNLAVAPDQRRRRVASRLVASLLLASGDRGAISATLEVRAGNRAAIELYRSFGFEIAGRRPAYYPDGEDAEIMWLHRIDRPATRDRLRTRGGLDG